MKDKAKERDELENLIGLASIGELGGESADTVLGEKFLQLMEGIHQSYMGILKMKDSVHEDALKRAVTPPAGLHGEVSAEMVIAAQDAYAKVIGLGVSKYVAMGQALKAVLQIARSEQSENIHSPEPYGWVAAGQFFTDRSAAIETAEKTPCIDVYSRPQMLAAAQPLPVEQKERWFAACGDHRDTLIAIHGERSGHIVSGIPEGQAHELIKAHNAGLPDDAGCAKQGGAQ